MTAAPESKLTLALDAIPLFQQADLGAIRTALASATVRDLAAGTPLLRPGDTNHNVYISLKGNIGAFLGDDLSPEAAIVIAAGDCVGELSAIDSKPVSALVLTLSDAQVLEIPKDVFWYQLMTQPGIARNLMVILSERMRRGNERALRSLREQLELAHLRQELDVARQLQASMLPLRQPLFPDRHDLDICGIMDPASDIGGDLFDAFFVDEHRLFFCVGDVSGHGIAAALFMARTIGLLRIIAVNTPDPEKLLETLNARLCADNDTNIFVTLFCGFLDLRSGQLRYSNGGHCPPVIVSEGSATLLPIPRGALIGAFPGVRYSAMERLLAPGELLFCYTDGITEAHAASGEEFGEARCLQQVKALAGQPLPMLLDEIRKAVWGFTAADQHLEDDCTMLALRRPF